MIAFSQLTDGNGRKYVQMQSIESASKINLSCGMFHIERDFTPTGPHRFAVRHRNMYVALVFTRLEVVGGESMTDAELEDHLVSLFNCCVCAGVTPDCENECIAPPGWSFLYFSFHPGNQLDDVSQVLTNVRAGFGPCDDPCFELFSGLNMTPVINRGDFVNQVVNYITSNPPTGFAAALPSATIDDEERIVIVMAEQNCCDQPLYMLCDQFSCDEGPFDPLYYHPSLPSYNCCSQPAPCEHDITPGNSVFTFTFNIIAGVYTPSNLSFVTNEGDCYSLILLNPPVAALYTSATMATLYYNLIFAKIGMDGVVAVSQPDSDSVTVEIEGDACCGMTFSMNSTNPAWNLILADPLLVVKSDIQCCP